MTLSYLDPELEIPKLEEFDSFPVLQLATEKEDFPPNQLQTFDTQETGAETLAETPRAYPTHPCTSAESQEIPRETRADTLIETDENDDKLEHIHDMHIGSTHFE